MNFHTDHRLLAAAAGIGYLILTLMIAIVPAFQMQPTPPRTATAQRTAAEERGRAIYLREGCGFCHTQFVRDLPMDRPYGRPSVAGDYARENPPLLGTQRTGPDLANVAQRQPDQLWHLIHLYNPRAVVPLSVMPAYPWYFEIKQKAVPGEVTVPIPPAYAPSASRIVVAQQTALDLVAYLLSLRQAEVVP